jgi:hypothetical protein
MNTFVQLFRRERAPFYLNVMNSRKHLLPAMSKKGSLASTVEVEKTPVA